jgi:AraC-like DNA-binding protein
MTFYHEQILKIKTEVYSKEYLCEQVIQSKLFIEKEFSKNISLDDIATKAFFSKFHFIRLFKRHYGRTPYQYLKEVRITKAKSLLQAGMTVKEVCVSVGFDSITSFTGLFKKITGFSPIAYQNNKKAILKN